MVEAKTQLLWLETTTKKQDDNNTVGIPKTQLGFSLDQKFNVFGAWPTLISDAEMLVMQLLHTLLYFLHFI